MIGVVAGALFVLGLHRDAEELENRRCAGGMAAARPVRRVGWHCLRHLRSGGAGGPGGVSLLSQLAGTAMGVVIALTGGFAVMASAGDPGHSSEPGGGVLSGANLQPQDRCRQRTRVTSATHKKARQLAGFLFGGKDQITREKRWRLCR